MIHISQFYPCTKVKYTAELQYICELGKYLKMDYNECLSLDGVEFSANLKETSMWAYLKLGIYSGWLVNTTERDAKFGINDCILADKIINTYIKTDGVAVNQTAEELNKRHYDLEYRVMNPLHKAVSLSYESSEKWVFNMKGKDDRNEVLNTNALVINGAKYIWTSFVARVAVERMMVKAPKQLVIELDYNLVHRDETLSYILTLYNETKCFDNWVILDTSGVSEKRLYQLEYLAWVDKLEELGYGDKEYTITQKMEYMVELDVIVGDVVLLYTRGKKRGNASGRNIESCTMAVIRGISNNSITFDVIYNYKTMAQGKFDMMDLATGIRAMYRGVDGHFKYETANIRRKTIALTDLGVHYMVSSYEDQFFVTLDEPEDYIEMHTDMKTSKVFTQNELLYWILKDYNIEFQEDRFISKFLRNGEADRYVRFIQ